jgi:hypothetical protein
MKKTLLFATFTLALSACKDPKIEEKAVLDDVIKIHDSVMSKDEQLMHNKMKLDTLLTEAKIQDAKAKISQLRGQLNKADSAMSDWMQKFDPEQKGKSHEEIMNYLSAQKKQVLVIDSLVNSSVKQSAEYLKSLKK